MSKTIYKHLSIRSLSMTTYHRLLAVQKMEQKTFLGNVSLEAATLLVIQKGLDYLEAKYEREGKK